MWIEKNGKTWRIRELVNGSKVDLAKGYTTKTAARHAMTDLAADQLRGDLILPQDGRETLAGWVARWWPARSIGMKPNTFRSEGSRLQRDIVAPLGDLALNDITALVVQSWVAGLSKRLAPKSVRNSHGLLYSVMAGAVDERLIRANPCTKTRLAEVPRKEMRFLTEVEAERLLDAMPASHRDVILTLLGTGLRWGEIAGLKVMRFDPFERRIYVAEALADREMVLALPKSSLSRRMVSVPDDVLDALITRAGSRPAGEWLFQQPLGGPLRYTLFRRMWTRAIQKADLPGLRIHDLRHTHAAWLISAGLPLTAVQRRLGHSSITVTSDRYGHLLPAVDAEAIEVLNRSLKRRGTVGESDATSVSLGIPQSSVVPDQAA